MALPADTDVSRTAPPRWAALSSLAPIVHTIARVAVGLLFMQHGMQKLFGALGAGHPNLSLKFGTAGLIEFGGGLLIVVGLLTRPVALLAMIEMLVAFFQVHFPRGGWPIQNGGELPLLYGAAFLLLVVAGAGPYSVDAALRRLPAQRDSARTMT
ncbi:MAG TPA: DoxX family protein [Gemmatimonadaceae bacterium]|nr:DoxX family protein [Gemmatimonadaceae bacterium]